METNSTQEDVISAKTDFEDNCQVTIARDLQQIEAMRETWTMLLNEQPAPDVDADIDRYISVVTSPNVGVYPHVVLVHSNDQEVAMAGGRIMKYRFPCKIAYKTVIKPTLRCLIVGGGGILGKPDGVVAAALLEEFLSALRRGEADVVFLSHIRTDSLIYQLTRTKLSHLRVSCFPKVEPHYRMLIPESLDLFYQSCSGETRKVLRRKARRLEKKFQDQVKVVTYSREDDVKDAISVATKISRRTYQYALGVGFEDNSQTSSKLATAARHGWLWMSVLYVKGEPCAFQLGLNYRKTYFLEKSGFDPEWERWGVGTVLFIKVLEELCRDPSVQFLDFGFGDAEYKRTYANIASDVASVYIFAPRLWPISVNIGLSLTGCLSWLLQRVVEKIGLQDHIKRRWRNRLQRKTTYEKGRVQK